MNKCMWWMGRPFYKNKKPGHLIFGRRRRGGGGVKKKIFLSHHPIKIERNFLMAQKK